MYFSVLLSAPGVAVVVLFVILSFCLSFYFFPLECDIICYMNISYRVSHFDGFSSPSDDDAMRKRVAIENSESAKSRFLPLFILTPRLITPSPPFIPTISIRDSAAFLSCAV